MEVADAPPLRPFGDQKRESSKRWNFFSISCLEEDILSSKENGAFRYLKCLVIFDLYMLRQIGRRRCLEVFTGSPPCRVSASASLSLKRWSLVRTASRSLADRPRHKLS